MDRHFGQVGDPPLGLVYVGPLVDVTLVTHPALEQAGGKPAEIAGVSMMLDTGAQRSFLVESRCRELGLNPIRFDSIVGVSGDPIDCPIYMLGIMLGMGQQPNVVTSRSLFLSEFVGMAVPPRDSIHEGLLGRDFLSHVRLSYDGPSGTFTIQDRSTPARPDGGRHGGKPTGSKTKQKRRQRKNARRKNRRR